MVALAVSNVRSRREWAEIISTDWRRSIDSIIQTGRDLLEAKAELSRDEFSQMINEDLYFSPDTAQSLMRIVRHPMVAKAASSRLLPPSWTVLKELTKLSAKDFDDAQTRGLVGPDTNVRAARATAEAYVAPEGATVGRGHSPAMLPSPSEARKIARETSRLVTASDGFIYSGATKEEGAEYVRRREQTFGVRDAIELIAECPASPQKWLSEAEPHMLHKFKLGSIDAAIEWLTEVRPLIAAKLKVVESAE